MKDKSERKRNVWRDYSLYGGGFSGALANCIVDWASFFVFNFLVGRFDKWREVFGWPMRGIFTILE